MGLCKSILIINIRLCTLCLCNIVQWPCAQKVQKSKWHIRGHKFPIILTEREKRAGHDGEIRFSVVLSVQELSAVFELQSSQFFT